MACLLKLARIVSKGIPASAIRVSPPLRIDLDWSFLDNVCISVRMLVAIFLRSVRELLLEKMKDRVVFRVDHSNFATAFSVDR